MTEAPTVLDNRRCSACGLVVNHRIQHAKHCKGVYVTTEDRLHFAMSENERLRAAIKETVYLLGEALEQ